MHAARVSAGAALKDDSRSSTSARPRPVQQRPGRRGARRLVRPADRRRPDDQERRAAEERADAVRDREHSDGAGRSAARAAIPTRPRASASSSGCCRGCRRFRASRPRRCRTACRRPATASIPVQIEGKAYPQASDYPLAREGIVTAGYFDTFQTKVLSGREFTAADTADQPARGDRQRVVCADALPERRSGRPPDEAHPPGIEGAVADDRRRRAGSHHGRHRQQQREPGRLLHPDRAERRRQRRAHRGPHARRAPAR